MAADPVRPKLVRRNDKKVIAGVAAGIADYFNIDPILVRVAFVLLAFAGAVGFVAYGAAWLLIPKEGESRSAAEHMVDKVGLRNDGNKDNTWIWIVILSIAGVLILANMRHFWSGGGIIWALVLMGVGTWLYLQDLNHRKPDRRNPVSPVATPPAVRPDTSPVVSEPAVDAAVENVPAVVVVEDAAGTAVPADPADPVVPAVAAPADEASLREKADPDEPVAAVTTVETVAAERVSPTVTMPLAATPVPPPPPRKTVVVRQPRSHLGRHTVAMVLVFVGIAALLDNLGTIDFAPVQYGGLVLATLGGGLLIGSLWGRARGLIFLGILLLPFLAATGFYGRWFDMPVRDSTGDRNFAPETPAELESSYRLGAGSLNLNLNRLEWPSEPVVIDGSVGFGEINVSVPVGVEVDVTGRTTVGAVTTFDDSRAGFGAKLSRREGGAFGGARLVLDLRCFMGEIEVVRSQIPARGL